ncbi:MAG: DUF6242 domain-containing protein [Prevotella sp.]|jgi:hypothetical protein
MIKKLLSFVIMVYAVCSLSSCLKGNDDEVIYYEDTAVTGFSLGTLKRHLTTTAKDGITDSSYTINYNAGGYAFYIDQTQKLIYNPDSLPCGTDASKMIASITSKNGGIIVLNYKNKDGNDSLAYYNSKDSLNFSTPTRLRVYNMTNSAYREYTVKVNVHQQMGDEMTWGSNSNDALAEVGMRKIIENNGQMFLFGISNGQTIGFRQNDKAFVRLNDTFSADAYKSLTVMDGYLYMLSNGNIIRSADGNTWNTMGAANGITRLIGASNRNIYALTATGIVSSADNGATWSSNELDDQSTNLPTDNINFVCIPSRTNAQTNSLVLIGTRNGETRIWRKIEENAADSQNQPWAFYTKDAYNKHTLPAWDYLQVIAYDDALLALGRGQKAFYVSKDEGLTWLESDAYTLPDNFAGANTPFAMARDSKNMIYLSLFSSKDVWTGRLARLGWEEEQKGFTE